MMKFVVLLCLVASAFAGTIHSNPLPRLDGRIVGGVATTIEKHPYQISLQRSGSHNCGGSIISPDWVLTAAHCVTGTTTSYTIRAGSSNRGSGGTVYNLSQIISHSQYASSLHDYDFALCRVSEPIAIGATQNVVALPEQDEAVAAGTAAVCTGWGALTEGGSSPTVLQEVSMPIVDQAVCDNAYGGSITARMICAGETEGGKDSCQGDSGGPLVAGGKIVGVVSWGYGCARPKTPGVYSRVASVRNWIKTNSGV